MEKIKWVFFGTSSFSVIILNELKNSGYLPDLIITTPDKPKGRKLILSPSEVKVWSEENKIKYIQPETLKTSKNPNIINEINSYSKNGFDLFVVASYGKIIPQEILDIPKRQTLNIHPSLLPKLRGASPIQSAILSLNETGVTIMRLDAEMDHGPIVWQEKVEIQDWPPYSDDLEKILGKKGGEMLSTILPKWIKGEIEEVEQDHSKMTLCSKIEKSDGEINLEDDSEKNLRKIRAYNVWPGAYFFVNHMDKQIRVIIKRASLKEGKLLIERVIPEGKKEMNYEDFKKGLR